MPVKFDLRAMEKAMRGRRLGVVTTPAAWLPGQGPFMDYLLKNAEVRAFLALEHGLRGELQDGVRFDSWTDPRSGRPVYSFDRPDMAFPREFLDAVDLVLFHVQDVSHRAYTFHGALAALLEAAAAAGKPVLVIDRPTPLAHLGTQGCTGQQFFPLPFPVLPGLTLGELALWFRQQRQLPVDLTVLAVNGWQRRQSWAQTGLPWIPPSPNIPAVDSVYAYACTGIIQATSVAEGRGTCKPFEYIGAPFLDAAKLSASLNARRLPGVIFRELCFKPAFNKFAGEICHGIHLIFSSPRRLQPYRTMMTVLQELARHQPREFLLKPGFKDWLDNGEWSVEKLADLDFANHLETAAGDAARFRRETAASELY